MNSSELATFAMAKSVAPSPSSKSSYSFVKSTINSLSCFPTATEQTKSFMGIPACASAKEAAFIPAVLVHASACKI